MVTHRVRLCSPGVVSVSDLIGPQKGPAERGNVEKRQKSSKSGKNILDIFRHCSRRAKDVKNRQKVSRIFSTLFNNFRVAFSGPC